MTGNKLVRVILADAPSGAIVRCKKRWGVVVLSGSRSRRYGFKIVDFWDGGREYVRETDVVEVQA